MNNQRIIINMSVLTESELQMKCRERLEAYHVENMDWERVMQDKWALAALSQGKIIGGSI